MKRSIAALILCAVMALLASCGDGAASSAGQDGKTEAAEKTAVGLFNLSNEKLAGSEAIKTNVDAKVKMDMGQGPQEVDVTGYMHMKTGEQPAMASVMSTSILGVSTDVSQCLIDGVYYMGAAGMTMKAPIGDKADALLKNSRKSLELSGLGDAFQNQTVTPGADGGRQLSFTIDPEAMGKLTADALGGVLNSICGSGAEMKFESLSVTATVDPDGMLTESNVKVAWNMTVTGQDASYDAYIHMTYEYPGADFQVTAPQGMDLQNATQTDLTALLGA